MFLGIRLVYDDIANNVFSDISAFKLVEDYALLPKCKGRPISKLLFSVAARAS